MLLYLDTNLVEYCADYQDFIFGDGPVSSVNRPLQKELEALCQIVELEQFGEGWHVAAPKHLLGELLDSQLTSDQRQVYSILVQAWREAGKQVAKKTSEENIVAIECFHYPLRLNDKDGRHLTEAIALGAVWFLTNDKRLINHTRPKENKKSICRVQGVFVARPSECIPEISRELFLGFG
jgi:hypothetical protein